MSPSKVFVAGATGVIGMRLMPMLRAGGHEVVGMTRSPRRAELLTTMGVKPVVVDAFDTGRLAAAMKAERPAVVIHQLTDLGQRDFAGNARLRSLGTRNLVDAAKAAGVAKMIAQSIAFVYGPGEQSATEDEPLDTDASEPINTTVRGVVDLESAVQEMPEWVILRYGAVYGPGTWFAQDGLVANQLQVGEIRPTGVFTSFVHVDDAARAACLALDWPTGIFNVVDDEPAQDSAWMAAMVLALGLPITWPTTTRMPGSRGASNQKARRVAGWRPLHPSWRSALISRAEGPAAA